MASNDYSDVWIETFMRTVDAARTQAEVDFVARQAPLPDFRSALDLCCGDGRHAVALAERGYAVTAVDNHAGVLATAPRAEGVTYVEDDMRVLAGAPGPFDLVLCMWQSFGAFDEEANRAVLRLLAERLRPEGRLVFDLYHRPFFEHARQGRVHERGGRWVQEVRKLKDRRLTVYLLYEGMRHRDVFEWELFTPDELEEIGDGFGLTLVCKCSKFDENEPATPAVPYMQLVFERRP